MVPDDRNEEQTRITQEGQKAAEERANKLIKENRELRAQLNEMEARLANRQGSQGESSQFPNHSSPHAFQSPFYHQFSANHNNDL
uniref:Uncharacterized protein n=1 Tax=Nelumbo nucifera TaxID=4432 RepID=A0A822ZVR6_NELNU|nr:TPA_asm: hypothetical protein HUJ06_017362 [Nelumbo nucifera]